MANTCNSAPNSIEVPAIWAFMTKYLKSWHWELHHDCCPADIYYKVHPGFGRVSMKKIFLRIEEIWQTVFSPSHGKYSRSKSSVDEFLSSWFYKAWNSQMHNLMGKEIWMGSLQLGWIYRLFPKYLCGFFCFRNINKENLSSVTLFNFFFFLRNKDHRQPRVKGSLGWTVCETVLPGNWTSLCTISMV